MIFARPFFIRPRLAAATLCTLLLAATQSTAAPAPAKSAPAIESAAIQSQLPPALGDTINSALSALPRARDLGADQHKQVEDALHDALADDQRASDEVARLQGLRDAAQTTVTSPALSEDTAMAVSDWQAKLPQDANNDQLGELLEQERALLSKAQDSLHNLEDTLQKQTLRPDALREELATARAPIAEPAAANAHLPQALTDALRLRAQAAQRLHRCLLAALEMEQRTYESRLRVLFAERGEYRREVDEHAQRVHLLENILLNRYNSEVGDLVSHLDQERGDLVAAKAAPVLQNAAAENLDLSKDLVGTIQRIGALRDLKNTYTSDHAQVEQSLKNTQARIDLGEVSEEVGALMLAERHKLKPLTSLKRNLADLRNELAQTKLSLMNLREQQDGLENTDAAIAILLRRAGQLPVITGDLHDDLQRLLGTRNNVLTRLVSAKTRLVTLLSDAEQQLGGLSTSTATLSNLLDAHLLGTPSNAPIGPAWFGDIMHSLSSLAASSTSSTSIVAHLRHGGRALALFAALCLTVVAFLRRRIPSWFERIAVPMRRIRTDRYRYTMQTLALTLIAAAPVALLWVILSRFELLAAHTDVDAGLLGIAIDSLALPWFVLAFLHWLNREDGLAHLHFRWPRARRGALRRAVPWLMPAILLPLFMHTWLRDIGSDDSDGAIDRALFMLGALGVAAIAWDLLRPGGAWTARNSAQVEPVRMRQIARTGFTGLFIGLASLAALGYFFTAYTIAEHVLASLAALLAISTLHGLAVRWLVLGERRVALKRLEDRRVAEVEAREDEATGEALPEIEPDQVTVADLGAQTRRVLRLVLILLLGAMLLVIWADIAPALSFLDNIPVWPSSDTGTDGKPIIANVTLRAVLEAALILWMTFIATRNLPGLLEIGVLRRLNIDAPTRYAITSIVRYLIVLIGSLVGIGLLGVHWSNLQWLAAGLTVGLGFGLQEIFANFISGLIVLFERPCRIGDIITIGGVEGTVTRIRTRATTILDWDNKEVIVPNKSFITERLVNWTLSDSTTRIVIKVGIAYRSDPKLAQKLLLDCAAANELVLADPPPTAWMTGFGDSTQDFELRVYVAEINQRNLVRTELQMHIAGIFREHDIELAFPQRDLWLRNADQLVPSAEAISPSKRA